MQRMSENFVVFNQIDKGGVVATGKWRSNRPFRDQDVKCLVHPGSVEVSKLSLIKLLIYWIDLVGKVSLGFP